MMEGKGQVSIIGKMKEQDIQPILTRIVQVIRRYLPAESHRILLFGSWATLEAAPTSDIDIAIEGATAVDSTVMSEIHEEIDKLPTLRKIQIIDIQQVHDRFRDRVLSQGQVLT
jgi:predicted nucleotidyltransferase